MDRQSLANQVLEISQDYLGPAAERFLVRQIDAHLGKEPDKLTTKDLYKLIDWLKLSFSLLTDDSKLVDEYIFRLGLVAKGEAAKALGKKWQLQ